MKTNSFDKESNSITSLNLKTANFNSKSNDLFQLRFVFQFICFIKALSLYIG